MDRVLLAAALLCYAVPLLARWSAPLRQSVVARLLPRVGIVTHAAAMVWMIVAAGSLPLSLMRFDLAFISLVMIAGWTWLRGRPRMDVLGTVVVPISSLLLVAAALAPSQDTARDYHELWFPLHSVLLILCIGSFALAFALSSLFLFVRARLKNKRLAGISRLPTLEVLDALAFRSMAVGFVALTAGIALGVLWAAIHKDSARPPDITMVATIIVWVWYAVGMHMRLLMGWRGRLAAVFSVVGFGGLVLLLATSVVLRGWHGAGG